MIASNTLARDVYKELVRHLRAGHTSITYGELALATDTHPRSPVFHAALGIVTEGCRARGLPILPAIVWRAGADHPGDGYFELAHPRQRSFKAQLTAWKREHERVLEADRASWPASL